MCFDLYLLIFTIIISIAFVLLVWKKSNQGFGPNNIKIYGITMLIIFTTIITLSDIDAIKLTPVYSIFSAIAGYLFGLKNSKENNES